MSKRKKYGLMRILLIEDNVETALTLKDQLAKWFVVGVAHTGEDGENLAQLTPFDLFIVDISLPDKSGLEVCQTLRQQGLKAPILMLTASTEVEHKIEALNLGSDDYLTKPFVFEELLARIRALLRRAPAITTTNVLQVGELFLDVSNKVVTRQEQMIPLRRKEFNLLEYLMRNPSRVISRDMILEHVWDHNSDTVANVVDVHIKHLREKVDRPFTRQMIRTVHGLGYRLDP